MNETLAAHNADCTLTVTATHQPGTPLHLRYEVVNHSTLPLYLCDQLYEVAHPAEASELMVQLHPSRVHTEVDALGVHLTKAIVNVSLRDDVRALDLPYLSELQPGMSLAQVFEVAVPLRPFRTYGQRPGPAPASALPLWFALGCFRGTPELMAALTPVPNAQPGTYEVAAWQSRQQVLLVVGPFLEAVPVADAVPSTAPPLPAAPAQWTPWS
ncbi:MAG: hypothetical protein EOO56_08135 [Hymenobacter sp.]|nr:MAG: hypothetical protein EOO56_08135 [Hymenobacter sp.]